MKRILVLLPVAALGLSAAHAQNLLANGSFNAPNSTATPDSWSTWSYGAGYSNHEIITPAGGVAGNYDGSYQMTIGATDTSSGGGVFQVVPATAGTDYSLSVDAGAQNWWLPSAEIRLFFLDSGNGQLAETVLTTTDSLHNSLNGGNGDKYDTGVAYQNWTLNAVAPAGTTQAKVEFAGFGGGSAWFDNAALTVAVPEPTTMVLTAAGALLALQVRRKLRK
jgi:hypothetical protein